MLIGGVIRNIWKKKKKKDEDDDDEDNSVLKRTDNISNDEVGTDLV